MDGSSGGGFAVDAEADSAPRPAKRRFTQEEAALECDQSAIHNPISEEASASATSELYRTRIFSPSRARETPSSAVSAALSAISLLSPADGRFATPASHSGTKRSRRLFSASKPGLELVRDFRGNTALMLATFKRNKEDMIEALLHPGMNIHARNASGDTFLHMLMAWAPPALLEEIFQLYWPDYHELDDVKSLLCNALSVLNGLGVSPWQSSLLCHNWAGFSMLVNTFDFALDCMFTGHSVLCILAEYDQLELLEGLLEAFDMNVFATDQRSRNVLHYLVENNQPECLQRVISMMQDVGQHDLLPGWEVMDVSGFTPAGMSVLYSHRECWKVLRDAKLFDATMLYTMESRDGSHTLLHLACRNADVSTARGLIAAGADINALDGGQSTPLHLAADQSAHNCIRLLMEQPDVDPNKADCWGYFPIHVAAKQTEPLPEFFLSPKVDLFASMADGDNLLHLSAASGLPVLSMVAHTLATCVLSANGKGATPVEVAATKNNLQALEILLSEVEIRTEADKLAVSKAMHKAADKGHWESAVWLATHHHGDLGFVRAGATNNSFDRAVAAFSTGTLDAQGFDALLDSHGFVPEHRDSFLNSMSEVPNHRRITDFSSLTEKMIAHGAMPSSSNEVIANEWLSWRRTVAALHQRAWYTRSAAIMLFQRSKTDDFEPYMPSATQETQPDT